MHRVCYNQNFFSLVGFLFGNSFSLSILSPCRISERYSQKNRFNSIFYLFRPRRAKAALAANGGVKLVGECEICADKGDKRDLRDAFAALDSFVLA